MDEGTREKEKLFTHGQPLEPVNDLKQGIPHPDNVLRLQFSLAPSYVLQAGHGGLNHGKIFLQLNGMWTWCIAVITVSSSALGVLK